MPKAIKITLWVIGIIIFLIFSAALWLNSQWGQNIIKDKAVIYLGNKLKTEVRIGYLGVGFPKYIVIRDVLIKDQVKDTLLTLNELKIDLNMLALIHKNLDVQQVIITGLHGHIYRNMPDTDFNFAYIINAFAGNSPVDTSKKTATTATPLKFEVEKVRLENIHLKYDDYTGGIRLGLDLEHLSLKMKNLDLDKMIIHVQDIKLSGFVSEFNQDSSFLPTKPPKPGKTDVQIVADNVSIEKVAFKYNDHLNNLTVVLNLGTLQLKLKKFGLADNVVDVKKLSVNNTDLALVMGKHSNAVNLKDTVININSSDGWNVNAGEVQFKGVNFKMDNENATRVSKGID